MVNVSVVIKALNKESNIARAIESSLKAVAPYGGEVILADSGSADRTVDEAAAFPVTIVQLLRPEDRCCGVSQQLGYQHSRGEYVYLLDGDMELDANFLQRAIKLLDCEHSVAGVGGYIREMRIENHEFEHRSRRLIRGRRTHPAEVGYLNGGVFIGAPPLKTFDTFRTGISTPMRNMTLECGFVQKGGVSFAWRATRRTITVTP